MKTVLTISSSAAVMLTIVQELFPITYLPLGGTAMAQNGILFFGLLAAYKLFCECRGLSSKLRQTENRE